MRNLRGNVEEICMVNIDENVKNPEKEVEISKKF